MAMYCGDGGVTVEPGNLYLIPFSRQEISTLQRLTVPSRLVWGTTIFRAGDGHAGSDVRLSWGLRLMESILSPEFFTAKITLVVDCVFLFLWDLTSITLSCIGICSWSFTCLRSCSADISRYVILPLTNAFRLLQRSAYSPRKSQLLQDYRGREQELLELRRLLVSDLISWRTCDHEDNLPLSIQSLEVFTVYCVELQCADIWS